MTGILVDTNLLIYAVDPSEEEKRGLAITLLTSRELAGRCCISGQCLSEFANVALRRKLLSPADVDAYVADYATGWRVFAVTAAVVREALWCVREHHLNFWDAQIWAVAHLHEIETVLSEDFQDGLRLEGVRFLNPFRRGFKLRR